MTKKIFRTILAVGIVIILLSMTLFCTVLLRHYTTRVFDELEMEAVLAARGVELEGETYLADLRPENRITWVDTDGSVLYDSQADPSTMENHLQREEIQEALSGQVGQASRYSNTLATKTLYVALALSDGSVLRVASDQSSVVSLVLELIPSLLVVLALTIALGAFLAYRLSRGIIRPILALDLAHPEDCDTYEELTPLLRRIHTQSETIQKQMEELEQQRSEFTAITENMSEGFLLMDSRTNLLSCNSSALRLLDAPEAKVGESVLHLNRTESFRQVVDEALQGRHSEALLKRGDKCYQLLANCVKRDDQVVGAVIAILDVTERESREALRREFTANVSHELKTPLTSIKGFTDMLASGMVASPEDQKRFITMIGVEVDRLIDLINDILKLSELESVAIDQCEERSDANAVAKSAVELLSTSAKQAEVRLTLNGEEAVVAVPEGRLKELMLNLISNGIKYTEPGGSVTVQVRTQDGRAVLTVADTGIGIPEEAQSRVFERFYRVDKGRARKNGGTGLGLAIVKHIVQLYGGTVRLESEVGKGSTFTVTLPLAEK